MQRLTMLRIVTEISTQSFLTGLNVVESVNIETIDINVTILTWGRNSCEGRYEVISKRI